jgi:hypothetical protein
VAVGGLSKRGAQPGAALAALHQANGVSLRCGSSVVSIAGVKTPALSSYLTDRRWSRTWSWLASEWCPTPNGSNIPVFS